MIQLRPAFLCATLAVALAQSGCATTPSSAPTAAPEPATSGIVRQHGRLQVQGNRIVGTHGRPVSLAGNSFFWSQWMGRFYQAETVAWLKKDWGATIVRAALGVHQEDGYLQHPKENKQRVLKVVDAAVAHDLYVIIDWHDHHAEDHAAQAADFFADMARRYGHLPNVIYEIYNEPLRVSWPDTVKPYAEKVIAAIRQHDPDNLIVVGTPFWAQRVDLAAADPIKDPNVAYALHFYAGTHKADLRARAEQALSLGAALFVTEWGTCNADGNGPIDQASVREWMDFMRKHELSHCNWSVSDKRETASIVKPGAASKGGWSDSDLTPSGLFVRDLIRNWGK
ncbi:glycoside hydrolase family 5 protein [Oleiharenicola lentus]|jgi:endoglucanase|uniref:Glycoside hydrolase family 5 protein n=1 Tax=Oleiharenicola lentus TaxID=2508720 RepID=A0A4Q1C8N2_9BACT|nr:glycoside hydrolase family 5 protein [Oleiharenicola lentus]RXK55313.1 glycoside hydrolase family 5 protein [Oleiharenicola lentus]